MTQEQIDSLKKLRGMVGTVVTTGFIEPTFSECRENMRVFNTVNGFTNVEYKTQHATLVEAGRDGLISHMLEQRYDFCLQIDADATFAEDALLRILHSAYNAVPDSDAVGAYCQLKPNGIPTIDTGSGTWEVHWPGEGILPVIRTGAHFILCKRSAFEKMGPAPWFRTRHAPRALDTLAEMDNLSRMKFSGKNVFSDTEEWQKLLEEATKGSAGGPSSVGEDSGLCDRLKSVGGNIYVDCNIVTGHIAKKVISPKDLKETIEARKKQLKLAVGVLS